MYELSVDPYHWKVVTALRSAQYSVWIVHSFSIPVILRRESNEFLTFAKIYRVSHLKLIKIHLSQMWGIFGIKIAFTATYETYKTKRTFCRILSQYKSKNYLRGVRGSFVKKFTLRFKTFKTLVSRERSKITKKTNHCTIYFRLTTSLTWQTNF